MNSFSRLHPKMIVFEQSRKLWVQCGIKIEKFPLKYIIFNRFVIFLSQVSLLLASLIFTWQNFHKFEAFQIVYFALQNQWSFLSVSLLVSMQLIQNKIKLLLQKYQKIMDTRKFLVKCFFNHKSIEKKFYFRSCWRYGNILYSSWTKPLFSYSMAENRCSVKLCGQSGDYFCCFHNLRYFSGTFRS